MSFVNCDCTKLVQRGHTRSQKVLVTNLDVFRIFGKDSILQGGRDIVPYDIVPYDIVLYSV